MLECGGVRRGRGERGRGERGRNQREAKFSLASGLTLIHENATTTTCCEDRVQIGASAPTLHASRRLLLNCSEVIFRLMAALWASVLSMHSAKANRNAVSG